MFNLDEKWKLEYLKVLWYFRKAPTKYLEITLTKKRERPV